MEAKGASMVDENKSREEGVTNRTTKDQSNEHQLVLFQPPAIVEYEEEKHSKFLLWFGQKKVLLSALITLLCFVGSFFVFFSYKWILVSMADEEQETNQVKGSTLIILQTKSKQFTLNLTEIGYDGKHVESIDKLALRDWFDQVNHQMTVSPKNATLDKLSSKIVPEKNGHTLDQKQLAAWLQNPETIINKPQELSLVVKKPAITKDILQRVSQKEIASYTTYYDVQNVNRTTNLQIAAIALNNKLVLPDEIFSFNKTVGERSLQRGYRIAKVIVKGEYSEGIGGGISQVSSTLFNAVDQAGFPILQRFSLSPKVTFVPSGRDATVAWDGPDFRFKNKLQMPILIRVQLTGGRLTVKTFTVPEVKITKKKIKDAPHTISQMSVKSVQSKSNKTLNQRT
jgi:vancomycin resistance protein YoaR